MNITFNGDQQSQVATSISQLTLEQIQAELRIVSGTPICSELDAVRRRELWLRLDCLVASRDSEVMP
jgi:hypothetical protein